MSLPFCPRGGCRTLPRSAERRKVYHRAWYSLDAYSWTNRWNACPRRVRPVLMTAMTTILGLVPMVCSSGEGSEMMKPMGVVMMTGMVISTIATLFITPVYYSLTDSVASRLSGLFKKIKLPKFNFHKKNPQQ